MLDLRAGFDIDGAINGSLAAYRIERSNLPLQVSPPHDIETLSRRDCCYAGISSKSSGVDAELSGELQPGWRIAPLALDTAHSRPGLPTPFSP